MKLLAAEYDKVTALMARLLERHPELADEMIAEECGLRTSQWLIEHDSVKVHIGTCTLSKDLVWCECGRGLCLTGRWLYCPTCGNPIDQESYTAAIAEARKNGAIDYYRNDEVVTELVAARKRIAELETVIPVRKLGTIEDLFADVIRRKNEILEDFTKAYLSVDAEVIKAYPELLKELELVEQRHPDNFTTTYYFRKREAIS